jgi:hypothetical protein
MATKKTTSKPPESVRAGHDGESITWFADEFGLTRHSVRKKITDANVHPSGRHRSNPLYRVSDVAPYLIAAHGGGGDGEDAPLPDPDRMHPADMNAYWSAQKNKVETSRAHDKLLASRGQLLEYDHVEYGIAALLRTLREGLLVAGDLIDAEAGLSSKQRAILDEQIDLVLDNLKSSAQQIQSDVTDDELSED